jgi:hypothetical protein
VTTIFQRKNFICWTLSVQQFKSCLLKIKCEFLLSTAHAYIFGSSQKWFYYKLLSSEHTLAYKISLWQADWCKFCVHLRSLIIPPSPYSKAPFKNTVIYIKLAGIFMICHCSKLRLSKCSGSWVVSIKQNNNFKFQLPTMFILFAFCKSVLLKVIRPLNI